MAIARTVPKRVLIVEDDQSTAVVLRELLQRQGHTVEIATTGEEGLEAALRDPPEVILLDLSLPDVNGLSVAKTIRATPRLRSVWLVAVTGSSVEDEAARIGFDGYFTKPLDYELLVLHLSRALPERPPGSGHSRG